MEPTKMPRAGANFGTYGFLCFLLRDGNRKRFYAIAQPSTSELGGDHGDQRF